MSDEDVRDRLTAWLRAQLPDANDVRVDGLDRVEFGHSAEMMVLTVAARRGGAEDSQDVVLRLRPLPPALLEPYDLKRQFGILQALSGTAVQAPRVLWLEDSGDVLGRPHFSSWSGSPATYTRCRHPRRRRSGSDTCV
jgi:aminoglycoside phosphotransferase (APT) family kinase protein